MGVKVSVVVPVHNLGADLDACLESLLGQSLGSGEYEILMVDDGSHDGTAQRLEKVARLHPPLRAILAAHTGGPGRPRNIGIERAQGEYVYFVDPDDRLTPTALERMCATAGRTNADIVIGKLVGHGGRSVSRHVFRASRDQADLVEDRLFGLLTPHMLFRSAFLAEHHLRFAEGAAWLGDQLFVAQAYFRAKVISVLADEVCCHWIRRPEREHATRRFDPRAYYRALRGVLDVVDSHTSPGDERDQIYAHWYDAEMLRLLGGRTFGGLPVRYRQHLLYREVGKLAEERFGPAVEAWLPLSMRVRAQLLRAGAYADIARLARAERELTVVPTLERVEWDGDHLLIRVSGRLSYADGRPVTFHRLDGRLLWQPPVPLRVDVPENAYDVTAAISRSRLDVYVQNRNDSGDYRLPTTSHLVPDTADEAEQVVLRGTARLDPRVAKAGRPLEDGLWDCFVRAESCGWDVQRRIGRPSLYQTDPPCPSHVVGTGTLVEPHWTTLGNLSVRVAAI
jgi:glycosyltransferase involved in cell wall biosynthesis